MKATEAQIKAWKAKYGQIVKITLKDEANGDKTCYLHKPSRKALGFASMAAKENPLKFNEVILNECWIDGDEEIRTDDELFLSASSKVAEMIELKEAELEKL